jgi:hypothetical protein
MLGKRELIALAEAEEGKLVVESEEQGDSL